MNDVDTQNVSMKVLPGPPKVLLSSTTFLLKRLGFRARTSHSGEIELELELNPNDCRVGDQQCIAR